MLRLVTTGTDSVTGFKELANGSFIDDNLLELEDALKLEGFNSFTTFFRGALDFVP